MQMEITVVPHNGKVYLDYSYFYNLASATYKMLGDVNSELAENLHDGEHKNRIKMFGISPLAFGRPQNDSILFAQPTFFTICSAWPELMNSIGEGLVRSKELYIGSQNFRVAAVNIVMPPDFKEKMTWIPRMNSSFVVSETLRGEKKKKYIMPDDPKCVELMKNNLIHKWKRLCEIRGDIAASWTDTPAEKCSNLFSSEDIELNFVGVHKTKMHLIKTVPVQSFRNVEISMKAPLPLQRLAWSSGLGEMNSMCYGVVEPKEV
jgi:CRISPR-associated endoribonuclease Cas6